MNSPGARHVAPPGVNAAKCSDPHQGRTGMVPLPQFGSTFSGLDLKRSCYRGFRSALLRSPTAIHISPLRESHRTTLRVQQGTYGTRSARGGEEADIEKCRLPLGLKGK
jgi:hypothetical protein